MSTELNELRISSARFESEARDASITLDTYKDKVAELQRDIEEQMAKIEDLKKTQSREKEEEKEKKKQEMLNDMMSKIDLGGAALNSSGEKLRQVLKDLESAKEQGTAAELGGQTRDLIRAHLAENQDLVRDLQERLRLAHEESEIQAQRRNEVEKLLSKRDAAYEELLGGYSTSIQCTELMIDKAASNQSVAVADLKVSAFVSKKSGVSLICSPRSRRDTTLKRSCFEARFARSRNKLIVGLLIFAVCKALSKATNFPTRSST